MATIEDQLRAAIDRDPRSRYTISQDSGVDQGVISRLMHGGTASTSTAERLAAALGLEIVLRKRKEARRGQRRQ